MIGYLQGRVLSSDGSRILILTESGIGYEVNYGYFINPGEVTGIYIYHSINENNQSLWGFKASQDKKVFELLISVNKVGPSKAYPIISTLGAKGLIDAITFDQTAMLTQAPGIGKKMAEQIILSLKDKVKKFDLSSKEIMQDSSQISIDQIIPLDSEKDLLVDRTIIQEATLALESLGYKDSDFMSLINKNISSAVKTSEQLIKIVLKEL